MPTRELGPRLRIKPCVARSRGVNWFDTADSYGTGQLEGRSEQLLGRFIREHQYRAPGVPRAEEVGQEPPYHTRM